MSETTTKQRYIPMTLDQFARSNLYPSEVVYPALISETEHDQILERLGFVIEQRKGALMAVKFPPGWNRITHPEDINDVWAAVYDQDGNMRMSHYFQDNGIAIRSYVNYMTRYRISVKFIQTRPKNPTGAFVALVMDGSARKLYETSLHGCRYPKGSLAFAKEEVRLRRMVYDECAQWLAARYPEWENIFAYWPKGDTDETP